MSFFQTWIDRYTPWAVRRRRAMAEQIAASSQAEVWHRVAERSVGMRASEARGYIRARAAAVVHPRVAAASANHAGEGDELLRMATSEVLRLIIRQWVQARPAESFGLPQRHAA